MAKVTRLEQLPMIDFCGICVDEAGRCLLDAAQAQEYGEPVEPVPIKGAEDVTGG